MRLFLEPFLTVLCVAIAAPVAALELYLRDSFPINRPSSLAYDAETCGVWIANEGAELVLINIVGTEIRRFDTGMPMIKTLTVTPEGLLVNNGYGTFRRFTREGRPLGDGFRLNDTLRDAEGLHHEPDGNLLIAEDDRARVVRMTPTGEIVFTIDGFKLSPVMYEPQGVTRDPLSGNILVVDDNEGLNALFEFDPAGAILSVTPLSEYGSDAEGITLQPQTGTLFIGFDSGNRLAIFDYLPSVRSLDTPLDAGPDCAIS
jgi:hypothetical protein